MAPVSPTPPRTDLAVAPPVGYLARTRDGVNSAVLTLPLFVLYQVGILLTDGWRNGADFVTPRLLALVQGSTALYFVLNLAVAGAVFVWWYRSSLRTQLPARTFFAVAAESTGYALVLGGLVSSLLLRLGLEPAGMSVTQAALGWTTALPARAGAGEPDFGVLDSIVMSIGAGTYEELVFRVLLMGGALWGLRYTAWSRTVQWTVAIVGTSLLFSAFHYWPIGGDTFTLWSFMFRFVLGMVFAGLYWARGFAVAAYTHAIYDIFILVPAALIGAP